MRRVAQLALVLMLASIAPAQEAPTKKDTPEARQKIYRLNFVIYELEQGKRINERTYTVPTTLDALPRETGLVNVGDRLPIHTKDGEFQYIDIGLAIECRVTEQDDKLIVSSTLTLSSVVSPEQQGGEAKFAEGNPIVRQLKQHFIALVIPGKPTLVTSIDDINSKKRLQVELTATRME